MYTTPAKKMLIINILNILKKYTDENHRLSQKEISDLLKKEYGMTADRKAIKRNIEELIACGYEINYNETKRMVPVKDSVTKKVKLDAKNQKIMEENFVWTDFYLKQPFTEGELRWLIDGLFASRNIPYNQCMELIEKLENLSNVHFKTSIRHVSRMNHDKTDNQDLFLNIELLNEAIQNNKKVSFKYIEYGTDKKMHIKKRPDGTEREYIISPYQMAAKEGKYYLICNYDKYDDISNYRVDRIKNVRILDEPAKPYKDLKWAKGNYIDTAEYVNEHIYMYSSDNVRVKFRINRPMITDIIDFFGKEVYFFDEDESGVTVSAITNEAAMVQFAKSYAPDVEVLESKELRDKVREELERAVSIYR